jgi:putative endonuclease
VFEGFTDGYHDARLVYWQSFDDVGKTINREKQLKNWRRAKNLRLIATMNPRRQDLAADWYETAAIVPKPA